MLWITVGAIAFDRIYAMFSHSVSSAYMSFLFLYPLIGGAGIYLLLYRLIPQLPQAPAYRVFANLYNSGIAAICAGSLLRGIMDIAGTASTLIPAFFVFGYGMSAVSFIALWYAVRNIPVSE